MARPMRGTWTERIVAAFLILFMLSYVGYQAWRFFYRPVSTDTLYEYTVSRAIQTQGIAIRDETVLDDRATGSEYYPLDDASRVALGETVAEIARGGQGSGYEVKWARELQEEIQRLQEAQNTGVDLSSAELYNRDIKAKLGQVSAMAADSRYHDLDEARKSLTMHINKKQISNQRATDFNARIGVLERELAGMERRAAASSGVSVEAPEAGFFSKVTDGYENQQLYDRMDDLFLDDYLRLIEDPPPSAPLRVGKMVHSEKWYFAAAVPSYHLEWIKVGQSVQMQFDQLDRGVPARVYEIEEERGGDTAVLLLRCDIMSEDLINLRVAGVTIHFQQFTGIRVNSADLRFVPNEEGAVERGVFILEDNVVKFKKVDTIYEEQGFVLSKTYYIDSPDTEHVKLFDQIITKGTDLYDEKPIQNY